MHVCEPKVPGNGRMVDARDNMENDMIYLRYLERESTYNQDNSSVRTNVDQPGDLCYAVVNTWKSGSGAKNALAIST